MENAFFFATQMSNFTSFSRHLNVHQPTAVPFLICIPLILTLVSAQKFSSSHELCRFLLFRRVSQKQIVSHHHGFGNLPVENLGVQNIKNKTTGLEASGKFQEKLLLK